MNELAFANGLAGLAQLFDKQLGEAAVALYFEALRHLDDEAWMLVVARAAQRCKFMPRPSELLELASDTSADDRALVAWSEAKRAAGAQGAYRSVDFEDAIINAAIRGMGGWIRFCALEGDEADVWGRKEFERHYRAFVHVLPAELARPLTGTVELHNSALNIPPPPPVRIAATTSIPRPQIVSSPAAALIAEVAHGASK